MASFFRGRSRRERAGALDSNVKVKVGSVTPAGKAVLACEGCLVPEFVYFGRKEAAAVDVDVALGIGQHLMVGHRVGRSGSGVDFDGGDVIVIAWQGVLLSS